MARRAVLEALFFSKDAGPSAEVIDWVDADMNDFVLQAGARSRFLLGLCIWIVRWLAPLLLWRLPPFERQSIETRVRILERLERSALSMALLGVKVIACVIFYEHPDNARAAGLDSQCLVPRD